MRLTVAACIMAGLICGIAAAAQQPADGQTVTVTGCLERAQRNGSAGGTVVGTSASPSTADDEANSGVLVDAFMLTQATPASATATGTSGTTGTTTMTSSNPTAYGLVGHENELGTHTGAKIEVSGTIVPAARSGRGSGGAATASGVKRIQISSVKVIADHCPAQ